MEAIILEAIATLIPLALIAFISAKLAKSWFEAKWAIIVSQTVAVILLFVAHSIARGLSSDPESLSSGTEFLVTVIAIFFLSKGIAIYLIACFCVARGKSPYLCFVGVLNLIIALPLLVFGVWKSSRPSETKRSEMIERLEEMLDDPDLPTDRREWATDRLQKLRGA